MDAFAKDLLNNSAHPPAPDNGVDGLFVDEPTPSVADDTKPGKFALVETRA
jgi:hypothetical protein